MGLLHNKVILVTGGTSGIGRASAELFAREGAQVVLTGRRPAETIPDIINRTVANFRRLDGAFNNADVGGGVSIVFNSSVLAQIAAPGTSNADGTESHPLAVGIPLRRLQSAT